MTGTPTTADQPGAGAPRPPFDPEVVEALTRLTALIPPTITRDMIPALRQPNPAMPPTSDSELSRGGTFAVDTRTVPGSEGAPDVEVVVCLPTAAASPTPAIIYVHGGGMVTGTARGGLLDVVEWAADLGAAVVSVEYRLAPETPHPGPVDDVYAALTWVHRHATELRIDPARVVLAGVSAGGGLAAAAALMARDRGENPVAGQLLIAPMLDDRIDSFSAHQLSGHGFFDRGSADTGWTALLGDARGGADVSPYAAPARATDLSGLPPTYVDVTTGETFRDEDVAYATSIWRAGGSAELHVWPGGFHGFDAVAPTSRLAQDARAARLQWLRRLLASASR